MQAALADSSILYSMEHARGYLNKIAHWVSETDWPCDGLMSGSLKNFCNSLDFHAYRRCCEGDIARVLFDYLTMQAGSVSAARLDTSLYRPICVDYLVVRHAIFLNQGVILKIDNLFCPEWPWWTDRQAQFLTGCILQHLEMVLDSSFIHSAPLLRRECTSLSTFSWKGCLTSLLTYR